MADKIQIRRDLAVNWTTSNPTLAQGEFGYEIDSCRVKIGTGTDTWNDLPYKFDTTDAVKCQNLVLNLTADINQIIPHTFSTDVCNYKAFDSLGNDIELSFTLNPTTLELQTCSSININNVLIKVEGVQ